MSELIDWEAFGAMARLHRRKLGYHKADEFCDAIKRETGFSINPASYYKIETGKQMASVEQMLAILSMFDAKSRNRILRLCMDDRIEPDGFCAWGVRA